MVGYVGDFRSLTNWCLRGADANNRPDHAYMRNILNSLQGLT